MFNFFKFNIKVDKEIKSYLLGFLFSLVLTMIPFILVMKNIFIDNINYACILLSAIIQIFVHFFYFLHLNFSAEKRWNIITLLFILIIIFIIVFGSIWIMHNLNHHIMIN